MTSNNNLMKADKFKIEIPHEHYLKIMHWVHKSNFEVSGFADVTFDPDKQLFVVGDPFLCKQENHATETEMDSVSIGKAMYRLAKDGKELRWWWHSHVNMNVFWSSTDMQAMRQLGGQGWILATVFNKKHEMRSALLTVTDQLGKPTEVFIDDIPTQEVSYLPTETFDQWDKEYADMVTIAKPVSKHIYQSNYEWDSDDYLYGQVYQDYSKTWDRNDSPKSYSDWEKEEFKKRDKKKPAENKESRPETFPKYVEADVELLVAYFGITKAEFWKAVNQFGEQAEGLLYNQAVANGTLNENVFDEMEEDTYGIPVGGML